MRDGNDPASLALVASGAKSADPRKLRMSDGVGDSGTPLASLKFEVWELDGRLANSGQHDWCAGVRLGPNADGTLAAPAQTPRPGSRRTAVRDILELLSRPGQVGCPVSMNTDARLGYATMGYQSLFLAFQDCDAQGLLLVRLAGQATTRRGPKKSEPSRREKIGAFATKDPPY